MRAPIPASCSAATWPMPEVAPVMTTTLLLMFVSLMSNQALCARIVRSRDCKLAELPLTTPNLRSSGRVVALFSFCVFPPTLGIPCRIPNSGRVHEDESSQGGFSGCGAGHAVFARDQGAAQGNAAAGGQTHHPVRRGRSAGRGMRPDHHDHRAR